MKIAILGATSQIAKDLIVSCVKHTDHHCILFSRCPEVVRNWLQSVDVKCAYVSKAYDDFKHGHYDAVINFVGVGDPARAKEMGSKIFDITYQYDQLALGYIQQHPQCKYIFLSSGAVYGDIFSEPATESSVAKIPVNQLDETYWYTIAKLHAEGRHRALTELSIVDLRVFNYFSHTQDMSARFLITDIVRAIQSKTILETTAENITRDFLHPDDFFQLVQCILNAGFINRAIDCYSKEAIDKASLLDAMESKYGLKYKFIDGVGRLNATGNKVNYYSLDKRVKVFGYQPVWSSLKGILNEVGRMQGQL